MTHHEQLPPPVRRRFDVRGVLGRGGSGVVYLAWDAERATEVALKVIDVSRREPARLARIKREFRAGQRLDHPHVVRTLDLFEGDGVWCFTMERLATSLRAVIEAGPTPARRAVEVVLEVLAALDHVHARGIVHRDLKPGNVLLDAHGAARVVDFGVARMGELGGAVDLRDLAGTPRYMAPEALFEDGGVDPRADLYAVGLLLHELIAGEHPLAGAPGADPADRPPRREPATLPHPEVGPIVRDLLAREPGARPRSARAVFERLAAVYPPARPIPPLRGSACLAQPPLVGRGAELEAILAWMADRMGHPSAPPVLVVQGGAGSGKTRLLRSVVRGARDLGASVSIGACTDDGAPFHGVQPMLDLLWTAPGADTFLDWRVTVDPRATWHPPPADADTAKVESRLRVLYEQTADRLIEVALHVPVLLVVEDAHWADEPTRQLLARWAHALRSQPTARAGLLITTRTTGPVDGAAHVTLPPLDEGAVTDLVAGMLMRPAGQDVRLLARHLRADGSATPLRVVQAMHALVARRSAEVGWDGTWAPGELSSLPHSVEDAVGERASRLSGVSKEMLAHAAVLGHAFAVGELAAAMSQGEVLLQDHLDEAAIAGIVAQHAASPDRWEFSHREVRGALLAALADRLPQLHARAADGLRAVHGDSDAIAPRLARHLAGCARWHDAWTWGTRAGEWTFARHGFHAAADAYAAAFTAARHAGVVPDAAPWTRYGDACRHAGRLEEAGRAYRTALETLDGLPRLAVLGKLADLEIRSARLHAAMEPLDGVLHELGLDVPAAPDLPARLEALERGLASLDDVPSLPAERIPYALVLCEACCAASEVAYYSRPAWTRFYAAVAASLACAMPPSAAGAHGLALYGYMEATRGRHGDAERVLSRAVATAVDAADPVGEILARSFHGNAALVAGCPAISVERTERAWRLAREVGEPLGAMTAGGVRGHAQAAAGDVGGAVETAAWLSATGERYGYPRLVQMARVVHCAASLAAGRFDEVVALVDAEVDGLEASGNAMVAATLRAYGALARALTVDPRAEPGLSIAEAWLDAGFTSLTCNVEAYALAAGVLEAARGALPHAARARLAGVRERGAPIAARNRSKTGLFVAAGGLLDAVHGDATGWDRFDDGLAHAVSHGLRCEERLIRVLAERVGPRPA